MAEEFDKFLEEVEQDIRQEKYLKLWKDHGKKVIYFLSGVVGLIALYALWQHYEAYQQGQSSQKFMHAQDLIGAHKNEAAIDMLNELSVNGYGSYKARGQLLLAALLREEGPKQDVARSLKIYDTLAQDTKIRSIFRDFSLLMAVSLRIAQPEAVPEKLLEQLAPLLEEKNPWRYQAMELQATLLSLSGDKVKAAEIFSTLARQADVPKDLMARAQIMTQAMIQEEKAS